MRRSAVRHGPIATALGLLAPLVIAGLAAGEGMGDGDGAGFELGVVGVGAALGVRDGVGAAQPVSKTESRAIASIFIVNWDGASAGSVAQGFDRGSVQVIARERNVSSVSVTSRDCRVERHSTMPSSCRADLLPKVGWKPGRMTWRAVLTKRAKKSRIRDRRLAMAGASAPAS
jgi:hypothetical protein